MGRSANSLSVRLEQRCRNLESTLRRELTERLRCGGLKYPKGRERSGRAIGNSHGFLIDYCSAASRARILEAVFEADFLECSYGFRPGRSPHHALRALRVQIVDQEGAIRR